MNNSEVEAPLKPLSEILEPDKRHKNSNVNIKQWEILLREGKWCATKSR